jgi:hypothetical protein
MTGLVDFNRPAFAAETARLRALGHWVLDPTELDHTPNETTTVAEAVALWKAFLVRDVSMLLTCALDAIVVLPGWEDSRGAMLEVHVALLAGMQVLEAIDLRPLELDIAWVGA